MQPHSRHMLDLTRVIKNSDPLLASKSPSAIFWHSCPAGVSSWLDSRTVVTVRGCLRSQLHLHHRHLCRLKGRLPEFKFFAAHHPYKGAKQHRSGAIRQRHHVLQEPSLLRKQNHSFANSFLKLTVAVYKYAVCTRCLQLVQQE